MNRTGAIENAGAVTKAGPRDRSGRGDTQPTERRDEAPLLRASAIAKRFGGVAAVDGMDIEVRRGLITGLIGPNGAGKSTFFNVIGGIIPPDDGTVVFKNEDITGRSSHEICLRGLVRTFQLARELGRMTVLENVMLAAPSQPGESLVKCLLRRFDVRRAERRVLGRAMEILELVRLSERRDAYAADLSGGQKKLLEIARALMTDCDLILLDEPCAGVNPALTNDIAALIVMLNRDHGKSFLIVEHDMAFVRTICDRVVVMTEGRRLTEGLFADIRRDERVISAYLGQSA